MKMRLASEKDPRVGHAEPAKEKKIPVFSRDADAKLYLIGWLDGGSFMARQMDKKCKACGRKT